MYEQPLRDFRYDKDKANCWEFGWKRDSDKDPFIQSRYVKQPKKQVLSWRVLYEDVNRGKITVLDLLAEDCFFYDILVKVKKKYGKNFEEFADHVHSELMSIFWSRCEWEVTIADYPTHITKEELAKLVTESKENDYYCYDVNLRTEERLDVYDQVMLNWDQFIHYLWDNKRKLVNHKK